MRIWTIQTPDVYDKILKDGIYICDEEKISFFIYEDFRRAYDWISNIMKQRISGYDVKYPIWGWYIIDGKNKKPDLRCSGYSERGKDLVCIEAQIPDERVLLSDFDLWHFVLNDYLFDENDDLDENLLEDIQELKEESWKKIFVSKDFIQGAYIQATFDKLKLEEIVKVIHFKAK